MGSFYTSLDQVNEKKVWLTIGAYDGVHLGHRQVLYQLSQAARNAGGIPAVLTFDPHPVEVLRGKRQDFYITDPPERADLLMAAGMEIVVSHPFTEVFANLSAWDFLQYLNEHLQLDALWVGYDFAMGHNREGDIPTLRKLCEEKRIRVQVIEPLYLDGEVISSSRVRRNIKEGNVSEAAKFLGRPFRLSGPVSHGDKRGRRLGFRTSNIQVAKHRIVPANGVYVCNAILPGETLSGLTNIGVRPTFEEGEVERRIETHFLDYDGRELYGEEMTLEFLELIRSEKRFENPQHLINQINSDIAFTRAYLSR
ncbi:MAG: riboflavin biosynthesis protein RibF [Anaerolineales bacterium]|nr:riboflavin biosynthesis protein RibF [Anaerolineales bacterium]